ncbi:MAG: tetrahydromethanopterin S-methyltransferase subunit H, partial [Candidatus Hodarchaeota archaeon]
CSRMFVFEREQYIYDVGGVKIGGNLGENPTVLAGTIFYAGDKSVTDSKKGRFNQEDAITRLSKQDEISDITGNPALIQVFSESQTAMEKYIDFVTGLTDTPILVDSTDSAVRIAGLMYAEEVGLLDRVIYNSINLSATDDEINALKELQHECAIVLAFNPEDQSIAGRRAVLENGAISLKTGLLTICEEVGVSKPLIDTTATAMGAGAGSAVSFTFVSKTVYGHPTGCGIHNAPSSWAWLRKHKKDNRDAFTACDISSNLVAQALGADFLLYGPISNAGQVFPAVAMADIFAAEAAKLEFGIEPHETHPYKRLL